ncbi:universal stress protein [Nocardia arthritidis]|uniref:Universal stress protein n=1 Tax=Nocardia arthritidis TaxID=228602 RepID=A0A6G9YHK2_9NOCA|nr:universal stress protein [Nocardia arthritidis]QIS12537.1 universal stress protein [Nocardia arthritidis]
MSSRSTDTHLLATAPVVVGVDGSEPSDLAVRWAAEIAAARNRRLRIVHGLALDPHSTVFGIYELLTPAVTDAMRKAGLDLVATARRLATQVDPGLTVETEVAPDQPAELLVRESNSAHMVAIGAGRASELAHIGSTLLAVSAHGHGNIVVVRDTGSERQIRQTGPVIVGIDDSRTCAPAVAAAFAEASIRETALVAVHATGDITLTGYANLAATLPIREMEAAAHEVLAEHLAGWQEKYPDVHVTRKVYPAGPAHQLISWSKAAQLVVVGSRGRGGFRGLLLGSTSNSLVQHAHCPVMVAHAN